MQSVNFEYIKQLSGFEGLYNCCYEVECFAAKNPDISGCSILGNKDSDGNWNFLSGIDYVAYAPDLKQGLPVTEQLRVFSRDEYITMWKSLELIRYKVSSELSRKLKKIYGQSYTVTAAQYGDIASVQSFENSGKKKRAVNEYFVAFPLLIRDGINKILQ